MGIGLSFWSVPARLTPDAGGPPSILTGHTVKYCAAIANDGNAAWPNATAGTTVQGTCITANGFEGTAIRACSAAAVWGSITTACTAVQPNCPAIVNYQGRSNWPSTASGVTATGTCAYGYTNSSNVFPQRKCLGQGAGVWDTTVEFDCTRTFLSRLHERLRAHTCHVAKRTLTPATLGPPCMRYFFSGWNRRQLAHHVGYRNGHGSQHDSAHVDGVGVGNQVQDRQMQWLLHGVLRCRRRHQRDQ